MVARGGAGLGTVRIGVVVDGLAEYASLGLLWPKLTPVTGHTYLRVLKADIQPLAPFPVIARACRDALRQLAGRGVDRILVVFDREDRGECPPAIATAVQRALREHSACPVTVVVKDRQYENWLVADLEACARHPVRYRVAPRHRRATEPDRADIINATAVLKSIVNGDYDKIEDAKNLLVEMDPLRAAANSRSFRKLLRELDHPAYRTQSRAP
jgi:hypothetical protein